MEHKAFAGTAPSLIKLGACLLYELLTLIAIVFVSAGLFLWLFGDASYGFKRLLLQLYLWGVIGAYFVWCWLKSGQTLAMQAWKIKLLDQHNQLLSLKVAVLRYALASMSFMLCGIGFLWAIIDKERLFLHDRLLQCRLVLPSVDVTQHP
jgi:uncharacterized RDD family membrane protein YckC